MYPRLVVMETICSLLLWKLYVHCCYG